MSAFKDGQMMEVNGRISRIEIKNSGKKHIYIKNALIDGHERHDRFLLILDEDDKDIKFKYGNKIKATGTYKEFKEARNFGNFDEKDYFRSLAVAGRIYVDDINIKDESYDLIGESLHNIKERLMNAFSEISGKEQAGIMNAIVTGDRSMLDDDEKMLYQQSGIAHILAISGLHISLLGAALYKLFKKIVNIKTAAFITAFLMIAFFIMTGGQVSACRAVIMYLIYITADVLGKDYDILSAIPFAAIIIMAADTYIIFNSAFPLSFLAVISIPALAQMSGYMDIRNRFANAFFTSLSVTLSTLPVIAGMYYQIPLYSVFLNLLVIPLMSIILFSSFISGILAAFYITAGRFAAGLGIYLLMLLDLSGHITLRLPYGMITTGYISPVRMIIYYAILILFLIIMTINKNKLRKTGRKRGVPKRRYLKMIFTAAVVISCFLCICIPDRNEALRLCFFDVDQGDGIMIQNKNGGNYFIDGGSSGINDLLRYRLESAIRYEGVKNIDYWIISHPDKDHISGLLELLEQRQNRAGDITVKNILIPDMSGNEMYERLKDAANEKKINFKNIYSGTNIYDGDLKLSCIYPDKGYKTDDANDNSCVIELSYNGFNAIFTGDISKAVEERLIKEKRLHETDVLKVAHHGSKNSTSENFLNEIRPSVAVISAGENNSYGHPHDDTIKRLKDFGCMIEGTYKSGEICMDVSPSGDRVNIDRKIR